MKILLSSPAFFPHSFGGGEMYAYRLAKELLCRNYKVEVVTQIPLRNGKESHAVENYEYEGIKVAGFWINPEALNPVEKQIGIGPLSYSILRKILEEHSPDFVHINGMKPGLTSICNELRIPHAITAHHTGIICPGGALLKVDNSICNNIITPQKCVPCCNVLRWPKWYTGGLLSKIPHWIYRPIGEYLKKKDKLSYIERGLIYSWLIEESIIEKKGMLESVQVIIAPSRFMRDLLIRNGSKPEKTLYIPHAIEPLQRSDINDIKGRVVRFGYVGRIDRAKGLHLLLQALEQLPNNAICELHIFGAARNVVDEEYRRKALSSYRGASKLFNHGLVPQNKLQGVFDQIDVLIVPSILPESFGLVVLEAFSAGRPVIVFNSGALPELVRDGVDGFIIEKNDSKSLSEVIQRFIDNPDMILEMAENIRPVKPISEYANDIERVYKKPIGK